MHVFMSNSPKVMFISLDHQITRVMQFRQAKSNLIYFCLFVVCFAEPSFISGAFATMGLIAGISGHPVTGVERLIDKHAEESKAVLFERPEYKKANDYISIKVSYREFSNFVRDQK